MSTVMPSLAVTESGGVVRLQLGCLAHGEGRSLQDAADDLVSRVRGLAMAIRSGGCSISRELAPDLETLDFLHELAAVAAAGGDIRARIFG